MSRNPRTSRARSALTVLAGASIAAGLLATTVAPASADKGTPDQEPKPTVVLVHGAFADSSSWNGVISRLRHDGYRVVAVANPLRSLSGDSAYLKNILAGIDGPIVLAGHSYGGSVISNAATGNDNVRALVHLAAFLPEKGESAVDLSGTSDLNIPPAAQEFMAERAGAHTTQVRASHAVSVLRHGTVTEVIEEAARAVR